MAAGTPWVLKKFQVDHTGMTGTYLNIEARQPGFGAFLLNLMGLDPNASVRVTSGAISMRQASIYGMDQVTAALTSVGAFLGGFKKPVPYLFTAALFFITGVTLGITVPEFGGFMLGFCFLVSLVNVVLYVFKKEMYIGFETAGGDKHTLVFRQAVIEGISVDIARVESVIEMVNDLITEAASGKPVNRTIPMSMVGSNQTIQAVPQQEVAMAAVVPTSEAPTEPPQTSSPGLRPGDSGPFS